MEMANLDMLVPENLIDPKFAEVFDFVKIEYRLKKLEKKVGRTGYGMVKSNAYCISLWKT